MTIDESQLVPVFFYNQEPCQLPRLHLVVLLPLIEALMHKHYFFI